MGTQDKKPAKHLMDDGFEEELDEYNPMKHVQELLKKDNAKETEDYVEVVLENRLAEKTQYKNVNLPTTEPVEDKIPDLDISSAYDKEEEPYKDIPEAKPYEEEKQDPPKQPYEQKSILEQKAETIKQVDNEMSRLEKELQEDIDRLQNSLLEQNNTQSNEIPKKENYKEEEVEVWDMKKVNSNKTPVLTQQDIPLKTPKSKQIPVKYPDKNNNQYNL